MKNTIKIIIILSLFFVTACGSDAEAPAPLFECSSSNIKGVAPAGAELNKRGVFEVAYEIDPLGDMLSLDLLDTAGEVITSVRVDVMIKSLVESETTLVMSDATKNVVLTETSKVRFLPGFGSRIETSRIVDDSTLHIWNVMTSDPSVRTLDVGVKSDSLIKGDIFRVYDPVTQEFADQKDVDNWADTNSLGPAVSGDWQTLKRILFKDSTWRAHAMAHLATCLTGEQVSPATVRGLDTIDSSDDSATVQQALSCDDDAISRLSAENSRTLDQLDMITGSIGDSTIKGLLVAHAHKVGLGGIKLPGLGTIHIKPSDYAALASVITALGKAGAVGVLISNPAGLLLAGIGAAAYIAARVNDAFGEDILRAYKEGQKPSSGPNAPYETIPSRQRKAKKGKSNGDPHVRTFDGLGYDFMVQGDFVLVHSQGDDPLDIHVRQTPGDSRCPNVTYNWGVATQVGSQRISAYADDSVSSIRIDGEIIIVPAGGIIFLDNGALILAETERRIVLLYPSGDVLEYVRTKDTRLDLTVSLAESRMGSVRGLLGNFNGVSDDDIQLRNGRTLEAPVAWNEIYTEFRDSWLVAETETLLDYTGGQTPSDFFSASMPGRPFGLQDIEPAEAQRLVSVCEDAGVDPIAIEICAIDAYCISDEAAVDLHLDALQPKELLVVERPIFLDGWTQQGQPANGDWTIDASGRSVTQTINGDPTFFVSPNNFINKTIRGQFLNADFDDDYMGFVIGYQGPLDAGADPDNFKTLLFQWKKRAQANAQAGFTLAKMNGVITAYDPIIWENMDTPEYQVLATDYGLGKAWTNDHQHQFELSYEKDRLQIAVDGRRIFDISAAEAGLTEFPDGRFGFYNYSQPKVTYSGFSVADGGREVGLKSFEIRNFDEVQNELTLTDYGGLLDQALLLTDGNGSQTGGVWHHSKVAIVGGFSTEFTFRISDVLPDAGRGIALVIQNADTPLAQRGDGSQPGSIGYSGIPHSIAVEFDAYPDADEPAGSHVAVHTNHDLDNSAEGPAAIGISTVDKINDGRLHWAKVEYHAAGEIRVYLDNSTQPVLSVPIDLSTFRFDGGHAYIGFTSASRGGSIQSIHSWSYLDTF